jgi:succinoglycan biosynthesis transport protein ExoP
MEDDVKTLGDYISIAWRRKFHILIPFIVVLLITVATVFVLPPVYKSTGTILIESQQIPEELIQSMVTSFADERIQVIKQRIMTGQQLFGIIKKFDLYSDELHSTPRSEILDEMRERIQIDRVSADVRNQRNRAAAIIAFTVSFEHSSAVMAQKVANELVTLFLDENIRTRTARAEETSDFLKKESERLGAQIAEMEAQIANYKQENEGSLPESLPLNLQRVVTIRSALMNSEA